MFHEKVIKAAQAGQLARPPNRLRRKLDKLTSKLEVARGAVDRVMAPVRRVVDEPDEDVTADDNDDVSQRPTALLPPPPLVSPRAVGSAPRSPADSPFACAAWVRSRASWAGAAA